ncbi:MAG: ParA family protein [Clostridia bacterium]|nr:ParA family protein [Clostridia bacterium]
MTSIISVVNQKGGVGKTTTVISLAAYLGLKKKKVLVIDMDPQSNSTSSMGIDETTLETSIYDVLIDEKPISEVIVKTETKNVDICPTDINLAGAEIELVSAISREQILKTALAEVKENYDYIIIDCPPTLGLLTINALTASTDIIIPILGDYLSLKGLSLLNDTINLVKKKLNPDIKLLGVLLNMFDGRTQLARQVKEEVVKFYGDKVFDTEIPRNVRLSEAPSYGQTICDYDKKSKGGMAYEKLAKEVIKRTKTV